MTNSHRRGNEIGSYERDRMDLYVEAAKSWSDKKEQGVSVTTLKRWISRSTAYRIRLSVN